MNLRNPCFVLAGPAFEVLRLEFSVKGSVNLQTVLNKVKGTYAIGVISPQISQR
jgi:hypothetical protein